jgi:L,D-transpeptidase ErfK/SrfK
MFPEDITQIYNMVPVGTKVTVVDQPIKSAWIGDTLYLEVHPTQEQAAIMEHEGAIPDYQLSERDLSYIMRIAGKDVQNLDWQKIRKVVKERKGYPIPIAIRAEQNMQKAEK